MTKQRKLEGFSILFMLILFSGVIYGAYAQNSTAPSPSSLPTGQVPAPFIQTVPQSQFTNAGDTLGYGIWVSSGPGSGSNWQAVKGNGSAGSNFEGLYSNIGYDIENSSMLFETQLSSSTDGGLGNIGLNNGTYPYAISINCDGTTFPINLWNCAYFDESTSNITYVGDLPTFNNTFTFHNISLDTNGTGASSVTLTLTQQFIANWTMMTIKMDTGVDFTNMHLYSPVTGQEISPGTDFSLTLVYYVDMSNITESQLVGHVVNLQPTDITPTEIYYTANNGFGYQYNLANMNFADSYTEIQGTNQVANKAAAAYFEPMMQGVQGSGAFFVMCYQTFNNLTYGVTTGISSDPTIEVSHNAVSSTSSNSTTNSASPLSRNAPVISVVIVAAVIVGVALLFKHKRSHIQTKVSPPTN